MSERAMVVTSRTVIDKTTGEDFTTYFGVWGSGQADNWVSLPPGAMHDPTWLLALCAEAFHGEGVLVIPSAWHAEEWRALAAAKDWTLGMEGESGWTSFRRRKTAAVHVCRQDLYGGHENNALWDWGTSPADIARKLHAWHETVGTAYRVSAGITGVQMLRGAYPRKQPLWVDKPIEDKPTQFVLRGQGDLVWAVSNLERERWIPADWTLHGFDIRGHYLAAVTTIGGLPWDGLTYVNTDSFDQSRAGFWRVHAQNLPPRLTGGPRYIGEAAPLIDSRLILTDNTVWLSTPVMEYLSKAEGCHPEVLGAYLPTRTTAVMGKWAETMGRLRRETLGGPLQGAMKRAANETIGLIGRSGGRVCRPDWRWLIIDEARVSLLRKLDPLIAGHERWPVAIRHDTVWWADHDPDPNGFANRVGLRVSEGLGAWRHVRSLPVRSWAGGIPESKPKVAAL